MEVLKTIIMEVEKVEKTLQEQLTEVETLLEQEKAKGVQKDVDVITHLEDQQAVILKQMDEEKAKLEQEAAQQVRVAAQVEKVESIVLPFDFNDIFENAKANDMIIEVVKEFQRKAYEDHNTEIQTVTGTHKEEIRAAGEREIQLKHQNDELQAKIEIETKQAQADAIEHSSLLQQIAQLQLDKQDSDSKRDAAVKQLEEAHAEITQLKQWNDDLRAQAAHGVRKAIDIIDISPSEKLAAMVKETTEQKANRALTRWSEIMPEVVAPPVVPAGPAVFQPEHTQASDHPSELVHTADTAVSTQDGVTHFRPEGEVQALSTPVVEGTPGQNGNHAEAKTVTQEQILVINARLERLEKQANLPYQVAV